MCLSLVAITPTCTGNQPRITLIVVCEGEWKYRHYWLRVQTGFSKWISNMMIYSADSTRFVIWAVVASLQSEATHQTFHQPPMCISHRLTSTVCASCNMSLVFLPHTGCISKMTRLFQAMLPRQHGWADLQWWSATRFSPITTPNQLYQMSNLTVDPVLAALWSKSNTMVTQKIFISWIESIKTTSMEDVSTRVIEKIRNI